MKSRELRAKLVSVIDEIQSGNLSPADGRNIVGAANQINVSLQNEIKLMRLKIEMGDKASALGSMDIC